MAVAEERGVTGDDGDDVEDQEDETSGVCPRHELVTRASRTSRDPSYDGCVSCGDKSKGRNERESEEWWRVSVSELEKGEGNSTQRLWEGRKR